MAEQPAQAAASTIAADQLLLATQPTAPLWPLDGAACATACTCVSACLWRRQDKQQQQQQRVAVCPYLAAQAATQLGSAMSCPELPGREKLAELLGAQGGMTTACSPAHDPI